MLGDLLAICYLAVYLAAGLSLARRTLRGAGAEHTLPLACAYATALLAMLPALFALVLGFALPAALAALGVWARQSEKTGAPLSAGAVQTDAKATGGARGKKSVDANAPATGKGAVTANAPATGKGAVAANAPAARKGVVAANAPATGKSAANAGRGGAADRRASLTAARKSAASAAAKAPAARKGAAAANAKADLSTPPAAPRPLFALSDKTDAKALVLCVLPLLFVTLYLLYTHVLCAKNGAYYTGQSGYGDTAMHLAFIKSIAVSGKMPPDYPLLAGQTLFGYPFLCESVSSVFLLLGAGLKFSYLLPCVPALVSIFGFGWLLARQVLGHAGKASLAYVLFFLGSGFGFCYFFGSREKLRSIFTGYYTTPTNYVEQNIRWVNSIADLLVPQRATLMGWALLFPCLYLLYRFAFAGEHTLALPLGLLAGGLPLMQTHSLLALVLISAVYFFFAVADAARAHNAKALVPWGVYVAASGVLCLPQLFGVIFRQTSTGQHFLRLAFNWANEGDDFFWFYVKNIGLVFLLLLPAFLWAKKPLRQWYLGAVLLWGISECVLFQPNAYDNIKLLFVWFLFSCVLVAGALWDWLALLPDRRVRALLGAGAVFVGTVGSVLTLGREWVSEYQVFSADAIAAGEYVDENAAPDALFLTGMQHLNPVASLAGRHIVCGSTLYVYFHGMDYSAQQSALQTLYTAPDAETLDAWGVDYVYISSYERSDYAVDEAWYAARYPVWYQNGEATIYKITE